MVTSKLLVRHKMFFSVSFRAYAYSIKFFSMEQGIKYDLNLALHCQLNYLAISKANITSKIIYMRVQFMLECICTVIIQACTIGSL